MTQEAPTPECPIVSQPKQSVPLKRPRIKKPIRTEHSWFDGPFNPTRGESVLWKAVILQAMMDALSQSRNTEQQYHKQAAIQWLTGGSKDFYLVCSLADRDPSDVRRNAKKALMAPVAWRAAPGKGARYEERKAYRARKKSPPPIGGRPGLRRAEAASAAQAGGGHDSAESDNAPLLPGYAEAKPLRLRPGETSPLRGEGIVIAGPWQ